MKTVICIVFELLHISFASHAQAFINFSNGAGGANGPVTNASGNRIVGPGPYVADFFWSSNLNASFDDLISAGFNKPFSTNTQYGGYFYGGGGYLPVGEIPILGQVRVWDTSYGSNYYRARDNGGEFGFSNIITVEPSIPPGTPTGLIGLQGFQLQRLPRFAAVITETNTIVFSWSSQQTSYTVQQNPDLSPTKWTTVTNSPITDGQQQHMILPVPPTPRMFYRLVSQ